MNLSGGNKYNLGFTVTLQDRFSTQAQAIKASLKDLKSENNMFVSNLEAARNLYGGIALAGAGALREMRGWVQEGAKFDYIMNGVKAVTESTVADYKNLSKLANFVGVETMFDPSEIADAMRFMGMAGLDAQEIQNTIRTSAHLAGATMSELGGKFGAASTITKVLHGFQLSTDHAVRVSDMLTAAVIRSNVELTDLAEALKYTSATSVDLAVPLETTTALAMALGNAGIQGSMAGTAMENMFRYLAMGLSEFKTGRQSKAWEALGLSPSELMDVNQNLIPIEQVLKKIGENLKGKGTIQIQGILKEIFGVRGKRAGSAIIRMMDDFTRFQDLLKHGSTGIAERTMSDMMNTLWGDFDKLHSAIEGFFNAFTKAIEPWLRPMLKGLRVAVEWLERFVSTPVGKFVTGVGVLGLTMVTIGAAVRAATAAFGLFWKSGMVGITNMTTALQMLKVHMMGIGSMGISNVSSLVGTLGLAPLILQKGQSVITHPVTGARFIPGPSGMYSPVPNNVGVASPFTPKVAPMGFMGFVGKFGGFASKALGILGPIGLAASILIPLLSPLLSSLKGTEENTREMAKYLEAKDERDRISRIFSNREIIQVIGNKSLNDLVKLFTLALEDYKQLYGIKETLDMIKNTKPIDMLYQKFPMNNISAKYVDLQ